MARIIALDFIIFLLICAAVSAIVWAWRGTRRKKVKEVKVKKKK